MIFYPKRFSRAKRKRLRQIELSYKAVAKKMLSYIRTSQNKYIELIDPDQEFDMSDMYPITTKENI